MEPRDYVACLLFEYFKALVVRQLRAEPFSDLQQVFTIVPGRMYWWPKPDYSARIISEGGNDRHIRSACDVVEALTPFTV